MVATCLVGFDIVFCNMWLSQQLRNESPKRRVKAKLREERSDAVHTNDVWAMDFVHELHDRQAKRRRE